MKLKRISFIAVLSFLFSSPSHSLEKTKDNRPPARCHIKVHVIHKSKSSFDHFFDLHLKSKEACDKASKKHETNFNPTVIERVVVDHTWK